MNIPVLRGVIERRLLVNYRIDADVARSILPHPFEPKLVGGYAVGGICLIRLARVRPRGFPRWAGIRSENAAHRIAVSWTGPGGQREGVYIPRRDTSSCLNRLAGGRLFPGEHHAAVFDVHETDESYAISMQSADGQARVEVAARRASSGEGQPLARSTALAVGSVFRSTAEASRFFECGSVGYSATCSANRFDGLELLAFGWRIEPLEVTRVASSFFDDPIRFPAGSTAFDSAWLMRQIEHEWHARPDVVCAA